MAKIVITTYLISSVAIGCAKYEYTHQYKVIPREIPVFWKPKSINTSTMFDNQDSTFSQNSRTVVMVQTPNVVDKAKTTPFSDARSKNNCKITIRTEPNSLKCGELVDAAVIVDAPFSTRYKLMLFPTDKSVVISGTTTFYGTGNNVFNTQFTSNVIGSSGITAAITWLDN